MRSRRRLRAELVASRRRRLLVAVALALSLPHATRAQARVSRIGWLSLWFKTPQRDSPGQGATLRHDAFRHALRELGYVEGRNLVIEYRFAEGNAARLPALAAELAQLDISLLVALEPPAVEAARKATATLPIVMRSSDDPVALGWIASLARPGGNITGVTSYSHQLHGKRLQLLRETIPGLVRIGVLWDPQAPGAELSFRRIEAASKEAGVQIHSLPARGAGEFEQAFQAAIKAGAGAMLVVRGPVLIARRERLVNVAAKARLPAIYDDREFAEAGGLMSYGTNLADSYRRAAMYVDKILKGAKPADLPVEQPIIFELVLNMRAARALGLTIPPSILLRADRVIE